MKVCVYCASSATVDKSYFDATERLAKEFLKENIDVVSPPALEQFMLLVERE